MCVTSLDSNGRLSTAIEQQATARLCLLGRFRLLRGGRPIALPASGKAITLLAELALHLETGVPREELLETIWPDQDPNQSMVSLNSLVYSLQRRLRGHFPNAALLRYANGRYLLNQAAGIKTDVACFDSHIRRAIHLAAAGETTAAATAYGDAVALYAGDLCIDSSVQAVIERARLGASCMTALAWLADFAYRNGDDAVALDFALRLLGHDPCREDAHRMVMRIHARRGERAQALRQYRVCEQVLRREFDMVPEAVTRDLYDQIRADAFPA